MEQPKDAMSALINLAISRKSKELVWIRNLMLKHIKYERYKVMIKLCKVTNKVAVHARLLNDGQRKKYKDQHYNVNGRTNYLFDRTTAWSVGIVTDQDKFIYEIE